MLLSNVLFFFLAAEVAFDLVCIAIDMLFSADAVSVNDGLSFSLVSICLSVVSEQVVLDSSRSAILF